MEKRSKKDCGEDVNTEGMCCNHIFPLVLVKGPYRNFVAKNIC